MFETEKEEKTTLKKVLVLYWSKHNSTGHTDTNSLIDQP